jgi:hypothetical protein
VSETTPEPAAAEARQQMAAEVLHLGQALFDAVIATAAQPAARDEPDQPFPAEEVRAAAAEFFRALRLLLEVGDA